MPSTRNTLLTAPQGAFADNFYGRAFKDIASQMKAKIHRDTVNTAPDEIKQARDARRRMAGRRGSRVTNVLTEQRLGTASRLGPA